MTTSYCQFIAGGVDTDKEAKDWLCSIKRCDWEDTIRYLKEMKQESYEMTTSYCQFIAGGVDTDKEAVKMCYLL